MVKLSLGLRRKTVREYFEEYLKQFQERTGFHATLMDRKHMEAFDLLLKVWDEEYDVMEKSGFAPILSVMNLLAAVHVKKRTEELKEKLRELEKDRVRDLLCDNAYNVGYRCVDIW